MSSDETDGNGLPPMTDEDQLAAALQQGRAALSGGLYEISVDFLEEALSVARSVGDAAAEATAAGLLAQAFLRLDEPDEAARLAQGALEIAAARDDEAAARHFQSLLVIARSEPAQRELSTLFGDGRQALMDDDADRALPLLERALELSLELDNRAAEGAARLLLAQILASLGRTADAVEQAEAGKKLAEAQGEAEAVGRADELLEAINAEDAPAVGIQAEIEWGKQALEQHDIERGIRHFEQARDQAHELGDPIPEAAASGLLAQAFIEAGRLEEATVAANHAVALAESLGHDEAASVFRGLVQAASASEESHALTQELHLGTLALESGDPEEALGHLERALQQSRQSSHQVAEALTSGLLSRALQSLGRLDEARDHARCALEISRERGEEKAIAHFEALIESLEG